MDRKLRILFLPKWYPNKLDSLDGNFVENHARALAPYCDLAVIFVHSDVDMKQKYLLEKTKPFGFTEIRVYFKKPFTGIPILNKWITLVRYVSAQLKGYSYYLSTKEPPDFTHIHVLTRTAPLSLYLKYFHNIPFFITEHWSGYQKRSGKYRGWLKKWITKYTVNRANGISTVSEDLKNAMESHKLIGKYTIIPNVVNTDLFMPIERVEHHKPRFIHISNLSKVPKNLDTIIKILGELAAEGFDFEFIMIGYGGDESEMLELITTLELESKTRYLGKLTNEEVSVEMAQSDAMLLFSFYENQPVVMLEAFACGCPVIVPNVGGIVEIMNPALGIVVDAENNGQFKAAIEQFLKGNTQFNTRQIRAYAVNHFSETVIGQSFIKFYQD